MSSAENKNTTEHRPSAGMTSPQVSDTSLNVKHPQFMGMRGKKLSLVVSIIATTGFLRKSPYLLRVIGREPQQ